MVQLTREKVVSFLAKPGEEVDVLVAGGGPAGIGAALAAARQGAKTALLEAGPAMGGVAAVSGWMPMNRLTLNGGSRGGVHGTFVAKLRAMGPDASRPGKQSWVDGDGLHVHPDYLRLAVLELLEEAGCGYLLDCPVTGVLQAQGRVCGVTTSGKYGAAQFPAKVVVDATGDGDVAALAGASFHMGREEDGVFMPVTLGFVLCNVEEDKLFAFIQSLGGDGAMNRYLQEGEAQGRSVSSFYSFDRTTIPGVISVNNAGQRGLGVVNALDLVQRNLAERTGLQVVMDFMRMCREKHIPGLTHCALVRTGQALGVRETRRIVGDYTMTLEDAQAGKEFEDVVARRYGTIDPGGLSESKNYHGSIKDGHAFPYRCLLPQGVEGMLTAGRCVSQTHLGAAVCKSMGNMMAIGQAAGVAAALAAQQGITPRALPVERVQRALKEMGVAL